MRVGLIVGMSTSDAGLQALLEINGGTLEQRGWQIADEGHGPIGDDANSQEQRHAAEQTIASWTSWLPTCRADGALLVCMHLADALLVSGEAKSLVGDARAQGQLRCSALIQRFDDYLATRYVNEVLQGRFRRLTDKELSGRGVVNYIARLTKWQEAAGDDFRPVMWRRDTPEQEAFLRLLSQVGIEDAASLKPAAPSVASALDAVGVEALRKLNRAMQVSDVDSTKAGSIRAEAVRQLAFSKAGPAFAIPSGAARELLRIFEEPANELAQSLSPEDREHYLSQDVPPSAEVDDSAVAEQLSKLSSALGVPIEQAKGPVGDESVRRIRNLAKRAKAARLDGDSAKYQRMTGQLGPAITELDGYYAQGLKGDGSAIPHRVFQYWDPLPPPDEMVPWIESWTTVGFPGYEHDLATSDVGLSVVEEVAGDLGRRAFEAAPHAAVRADLYRYAELFRRGGWYVDAEHEALLPFLDVLDLPVDHVLLVRTAYNRILNNFIGAVPGSSFIKDALLRACQNLLDNAGGSVIELTGPAMFTEAFRRYESSADASFVVIPSNAVLTRVLQEVHNDAEYKIHGHWRYTELSSEG